MNKYDEKLMQMNAASAKKFSEHLNAAMGQQKKKTTTKKTATKKKAAK